MFLLFWIRTKLVPPVTCFLSTVRPGSGYYLFALGEHVMFQTVEGLDEVWWDSCGTLCSTWSKWRPKPWSSPVSSRLSVEDLVTVFRTSCSHQTRVRIVLKVDGQELLCDFCPNHECLINVSVTFSNTNFFVMIRKSLVKKQPKSRGKRIRNW